jgi:hypothetical protein
MSWLLECLHVSWSSARTYHGAPEAKVGLVLRYRELVNAGLLVAAPKVSVQAAATTEISPVAAKQAARIAVPNMR